jgi:hypothetical protein
LKDEEEARIWMEHISSLFFLPPCFLPPLAEGTCKPKVQVQDALWSHCKTDALFSHARNQVSEPSAEMELVRWPRAARSTTCEQDLPASKIDPWVWFCISHQIWPHYNLLLMYQWWR